MAGDAEASRLAKLQAAVKPFSEHLSVRHAPDRGCYIVAARDLDAGTVVVTVRGVGIVAEADYQKHVCDHCFTAPATVDWLCSDPSMAVEWYACALFDYNENALALARLVAYAVSAP